MIADLLMENLCIESMNVFLPRLLLNQIQSTQGYKIYKVNLFMYRFTFLFGYVSIYNSCFLIYF